MKKIMMMALMAAAATTAFAQDDLVKEAKSLCGKGEFDQAAKVLEPALTSDATTDKAKAWNQMVDIQFGKFSAIQTADMENKVKQQQVPYDTLGMNKACAEAFMAALKCDEYDRQPNEKGKVKLRYRTANQQRMQNVRLSLINAGQFMYKQKDLPNAFKYWALFVDSSNDPLFEGVDLSQQEQYRSEIAYYAALAAYFQKDYPNAEKYADIAAQDPEKASDANEILLFAAKENMKTAEDSVAYLNRVKALHQAKPEEERYFNLLMDYYTHKGDMAALKAWAEEEIAANAQNKMAWALKGEVQMNSSEWDAAVESYQKAIELNDKLADKKTGGLTKENADKVKAILAEAQKFLERARELDGDQLKVKWAYPLYRIYYSLQLKDKMAELEAIDPTLKQ